MTLKKLSLILCIILVLGSLIFFKYSNFLIENINSIFNTKINLINVIMPIGISFYTFQILSYIIDLYNKKIKLQKNYFSLALYVSLFPQLIAGPIVRYETVEEEIDNRKETKEDVIAGTKRFIIGLSKKVIIANQMALLADLILASLLGLSSLIVSFPLLILTINKINNKIKIIEVTTKIIIFFFLSIKPPPK